MHIPIFRGTLNHVQHPVFRHGDAIGIGQQKDLALGLVNPKGQGFFLA